MSRFDPSNLSITDEDARQLLDDVLADRQVLEDAHYDDWEKLVAAHRRGPERSGKTQGIGLVFAVLQSLKPYLFNSDPAIFATAKGSADREARRQAKTVQAALTDQWDESGARVEIDKVLDDAMICGGGFVRISYEPSGQFVPLEDYDRDLDLDTWEQPEQAMESQLLRARLEELGLPADVPAASIGLKRWSPFNVAFPAGYDEIGTMPRFAFRHLLQLSWLQKHPGFRNTAALVADQVIATDKKRSRRRKMTAARGATPGHVEVWEIWHVEYRDRLLTDPENPKRRRRRLVKEMHVTWVVDQADPKADRTVTVLGNRLSEFDMEGYPVEVLRLARTPDAFFGPSLAAQILPLATWVQELVLSGVAGLKAAANLKTLYNPDKLGTNGLNLLAADHPALVPVKDKLGVAGAVAHLIVPAFPQEYMAMMSLLNALMSRVSGSDEVVQGGRSSAGSATEVAFRASVLQGRSQYDLTIFEGFLRGVLRKMLQIMQQYFEARRWAQISGIDEPIAYSRNEIRGEWRVGVHAGSTRPRTPGDERAAMIGFLQAFAAATAAMQQAGVPPEIVAGINAALVEMWEINMPELLDGFAAMVGQGMTQATGAPAPVASGAATSPETGESLTIPAAGRMQAQAAAGGLPAALQETE